MPGSEKAHSGLTRRGFLKTAGVAGTVVAAMSLTALDAPAFGEDSDPQDGEYCGVGRCSSNAGCFGCEREVVVRDGYVVGLRPKKDAPYGRRPCSRGYGQIGRMYSDQRIKYPMRRVEGTERGAGQWERISWEEAIEEICSKWKKTQQEYGTRSLMCAGTAAGIWAMAGLPLFNILQATSVDNCYDYAIKWGQWQVVGRPLRGTLNPGNEPFEEDVYFAKTILVWGTNVSEAYIQRWRHVLKAQENGARVLVIDPNKTMTASRADKWYRVNPSSDPALLLGMMNVVVAEGLQDEDFLLKETIAPALVKREDGMFLRMSDVGIPPQEGAPDAQGNPTFIDPIAVWDIEKGAVAPLDEAAAPSLQGNFNVGGIEVDTAYDVLCEHLSEYSPEKVAELTGLASEDVIELGRAAADGPCTHITGLGWQMYFNSWAVGTGLHSLIALTGQCRKPGSGMWVANAAAPLPGVEHLLPTGTATKSIPHMSIPYIMESGTFNGEDYPIKAMYIASQGYVGGGCEVNRVLDKVIPKLDFIVCTDTVFSDSARYADIVLPCAHPYEREDIFYTCMEQELQYCEKLADPLFEAKPEIEIIKMLADGMGVGEYFLSDPSEWLEEVFLSNSVYQELGITLESLREQPTQRYHEKAWLYEDFGWTTPSKRMEFYCESPKPRHQLDVADADFDPRNYRMATFELPKEAYPGMEVQEKYPFVLYSVRSRFRWHSQGFDVSWFNEIENGPVARINPSDAESRGIADGDYVEFFSDRGHAVARTYLDANIRPGMVCYPKGLQEPQYKAGNFSELSPAWIDPFSVNAMYFDACVDMRKWEEVE